MARQKHAIVVTAGIEYVLMRRMINAVELFVGLRYLRARRTTRFVSFITGISMAGIALGVAAVIVILSVMNGFE